MKENDWFRPAQGSALHLFQKYANGRMGLTKAKAACGKTFLIADYNHSGNRCKRCLSKFNKSAQAKEKSQRKQVVDFYVSIFQSALDR